jgi:hypothetical protein
VAVSKRLRYEVFRRDDYTCRYCGRSAPEVVLAVDHVVPTALGGADSAENLVTACRDCNAGKSSSSPDAQMVADVADDALRWARAMQIAAHDMLAQQEVRDRARAQFRDHWNEWTFGGRPIDLPPDWPASVDRFVAAGLPMPALFDSIDVAMRASQVRIENVYRYMCGVAWAKVNELQTQARALVSPADDGTSVLATYPYRAALDLLIGQLPNCGDLADPQYRHDLAAKFDRAHDDDREDDGQRSDYSLWPVELRAVVAAIEEALAEAWYQDRTIVAALTELTAGRSDGEQLRARARQRAIDDGWGPEPTPDDITRAALMLAINDVLGTVRPAVP